MKPGSNKITIEFERRPCWVLNPTGEKTKAFFHSWTVEAERIGGYVNFRSLAIVEVESGQVMKVDSESIWFADSGDFKDTMFLNPEELIRRNGNVDL